jgi:hypothetical protein
LATAVAAAGCARNYGNGALIGGEGDRILRDPERVRARLTARGWADDRPVADNVTEEGRAQNRRFEINVAASEQLCEQDAQAQQPPPTQQ